MPRNARARPGIVAARRGQGESPEGQASARLVGVPQGEELQPRGARNGDRAGDGVLDRSRSTERLKESRVGRPIQVVRLGERVHEEDGGRGTGESRLEDRRHGAVQELIVQRAIHVGRQAEALREELQAHTRGLRDGIDGRQGQVALDPRTDGQPERLGCLALDRENDRIRRRIPGVSS